MFERVEVRSKRRHFSLKWVPILVPFQKIGRFLGDFSIFEEGDPKLLPKLSGLLKYFVTHA